MGDLIRAYDWASTSLGPIERWPAPLRTHVQTILLSQIPMVVIWGREGVVVYNQGYAAICGPRHPGALGGQVQAIWPEARAFNTNVLENGLAGNSLSFHRQELELWRLGRPERVWMDLEYAPILGDDGEPAGILALVIDITERVLAEQRQSASENLFRFLDRLGQATADARSADEVLALTTRLLGEHLGITNCAYADMDADEDGFTIRGNWHAPGSPSILGSYSLAAFGRLAVRELGAGRPLVINHNAVEIAPEEAKAFQDIGIAATICMPLVKDGRLVALMAIHDKVPHRWSDQELALLREVTERCWAHIERVGAEANLRAREQQLRLATEAGEVGLWDLDTRTETLFWPPRVKAMFGISADVPVSMSDYHDGLHPDDFDRVVAAFAAAMDPASRAVYDVEFRTIGKEDRLVRWVAAKGRGVFVDGTCVRMLGSAVDITQRKVLERQLRELNETLEHRVAERTAERNLLATIVETTDAQVQVLDLEYRWLAINAACMEGYQRIFGRRPRVGMSLLELLADMPAQQAAAKAVWDRALGGEAFTIVGDFGGDRHDVRTFEMKCEVLRDAAGTQIGAFMMGLDITDRVREQKRLAEAEDQLRQAQKMEAVGQLTGGIAHDFNNLLGAVVGGFDLIRRNPHDPARVRRIADNGLAAAERGAKLTGQLLSFSRTQKIENRPVVVSEVVGEMRDLLTRTLGPMIRLSFELDERRAAVLSDPVQLEMAVLNLAINARDAMLGGGDLTIRTRCRQVRDDPEMAPGEYVELSVLDTGTGMPPEVAARAFDPFFTTKGVGKGTGLGLSQVYGIVRQARGTARIQSVPGQGTAIVLLLPRTNEAVAAPEQEARGDVSAAGQGATILVVDDDNDMRTMLVESLRALGHTPIEATSGADALPLLGDAEPDLIIVDFGMPGMNGAEFAQTIRAMKVGAPIIFASGYADTDAIDTAMGGEAVIIRKPFRLDELALIVAGQLHRPEGPTG
jgi:PAS domain S-box-containing protein